MSSSEHGRMARGDHELPKVSLELAMPYPSTPYGRATPETALRRFQGWQGGQLAAISYPFGHPTSYAYTSEIRRETDENLPGFSGGISGFNQKFKQTSDSGA
jgi:hypothetical protein